MKASVSEKDAGKFQFALPIKIELIAETMNEIREIILRLSVPPCILNGLSDTVGVSWNGKLNKELQQTADKIEELFEKKGYDLWPNKLKNGGENERS